MTESFGERVWKRIRKERQGQRFGDPTKKWKRWDDFDKHTIDVINDELTKEIGVYERARKEATPSVEGNG